MDKQKEIATMQMIAAEMPCPFNCINDCFMDTTHGFCVRARLCEFLAEKGYGDVRVAVKEFAERVKMAFYYEFDELIPSRMADKIDELVKEICGDGD